MDARKVAFVLLFLLESHLSVGADTISANQFLSGDKTIVSSNGIFELGFFKPGKSSNYYIGIWYRNIIPQTVVWVANREAPVSNKYSAQLKIVDGNLMLMNASKDSMWSTNIDPSSTSVEAVLLNSGNLILRNRITSSTIWESFEHLTNTWLPESKLLFDRRKVKVVLTSWKSLEDPAPGLFSYNHESNGSMSYLTWNGTQQYWTSGFWNFSVSGLPPFLKNSQIFNYSYVINDKGGYLTYYPRGPSTLARFELETTGLLSLLNWSDSSKQWNFISSVPYEQCDVYARCGAFGICNQKSQAFCSCLTGFEPRSNTEWELKDFSGGCVRRTDFQCGNPNGEKDKFWMYNNMRLPQGNESLVTSDQECESVCLTNCNCLAYGYNSGTCSIWNQEVLNLKQLPEFDVNGKTIYVRLAASEFHNAENRKRVVFAAAISASVFVLLVLILVTLWLWHRHIVRSSKVVEGGSLVAFNFNYLQHATKNFSDKLGGGGFGSVFKGTLHDSSVVAVKKLESINQGEKQFRAEVSTLGTIHHVNLVRLRGFCSAGNNKLLVYDHMENGSLDHHLFNEKSGLLDWKTRYEIALGTARGLAYLHEKCKDYIIHSDIKPENILLDAKFCAKLADFGLAKLVGRDFSRVLTSIRGTIGYLAPEWISGVAITTKADVYSYGMVLFELISGRRNSSQSADGTDTGYFPCRATNVIVDGGDVLSLLDHRLDRIADAEKVSRMCKVAIWCIQADEDRRPSMVQVIQILEGVLEVNVPPVPLLFRMLDIGNGSSTRLMKVTSPVSDE